MTNSENSNLEDVSKGNDESAPRANDSTSDKETRFTKSKSISEVFKELEFEDDESDEISNDFEDEVDEIIPIHNEYRDLENLDALDEESIEGAVVINPDLDDSIETNVESTEENVDSEIADSINDDTDSLEFSESSGSVEEIGDEDSFITGDGSDIVLAEENVEGKIGKSSAQGVLINNKDKSSDSEKSLDIFDSTTIFTAIGFIVGLGILILGISYYASSSDRVVDNVLSGETAGLAIFLVIIGLIIIGFSLLKFFSSSKSSLIIDTFNSIKSIDYDEVSEDGITRDDFDAIFGILKRKKDSNFSDNDKSVDSSKDLFEKEKEEKLSEEDLGSLYSDSNLTSQKNQSSFKEHENANSTEISEDDDEVDEIIPIHSRLNKQSDESDLEDKYSKYDFEDDDDEDFDLVDEGSQAETMDDEDFDLVDEGSLEEAETITQNGSDEDLDLVEEDEELIIEEPEETEAIEEEVIEGNALEEDLVEDDVDSVLEAEKMDGLEDKYSKYDFDDDSDEIIETEVSKPQFKKDVDLSKFENQPLSEEELAEKERKAQELEEKKRRIIEGTNFDNSLRKQ